MESRAEIWGTNQPPAATGIVSEDSATPVAISSYTAVIPKAKALEDNSCSKSKAMKSPNTLQGAPDGWQGGVRMRQ